MSVSERGDVVSDLLEMKRPLDEIAADLNRFPFDCEPQDIRTLTRRRAIQILDAYLEEGLQREDLEYWAMIVERRTDIAYEGDSEAIKTMIFVLAHANIHRPFDAARAQEWNFALEGEIAEEPSQVS